MHCVFFGSAEKKKGLAVSCLGGGEGGGWRGAGVGYVWSISLESVPGHVAANTGVVGHALDGANTDHGNLAIPKVLASNTVDIRGSDLVDGLLNLLGSNALALGNHLASDILGNGGGTVQAQEERRLELLLGTLNLGSGDRGGQTGPLLLGKVDQIILAVLVLGDEVDTEETSVGVRGVERHERVGQLVLVNNARQSGGGVSRGTEGAVPGTDDGLHDEHGVVVGGVPAATLNSNGNVGLGHGVVLETNLGSSEVGGESVGLAQTSGVSGDGELAEVLLSQLDQLVVVNTTSTDKDHAVSGVVGLDVVGEVITGQGLDVLLGSQDGAAEGITYEICNHR